MRRGGIVTVAHFYWCLFVSIGGSTQSLRLGRYFRRLELRLDPFAVLAD